MLIQIAKNYHVKSIGSDNFIYIGDVIQIIFANKTVNNSELDGMAQKITQTSKNGLFRTFRVKLL